MLELKENDGGVILNIWLQPGASRTEICGARGDALKVKVASPPVEGKANRECIDFLAELFGIAKSRVKIISGKTGRLKKIMVCNVTRSQVQETLKEFGV